jgi:hypothetical protein
VLLKPVVLLKAVVLWEAAVPPAAGRRSRRPAAPATVVGPGGGAFLIEYRSG